MRKRKPDGKHSSSEALKKKMAMADDSDSTDYDEDDVYMMKNEEGMYPVKGQPGMYYKVNTADSDVGNETESCMKRKPAVNIVFSLFV